MTTRWQCTAESAPDVYAVALAWQFAERVEQADPRRGNLQLFRGSVMLSEADSPSINGIHRVANRITLRDFYTEAVDITGIA